MPYPTWYIPHPACLLTKPVNNGRTWKTFCTDGADTNAMGTGRHCILELRFGVHSASPSFQVAACLELVRKASVSCSLQLLRPRQEVKHASWSFIHSHLEFHLSCTPRHFQVLALKRKSMCERDTQRQLPSYFCLCQFATAPRPAYLPF